MEVLLLQDITGIGKKNDLLVVGDGFALNCLLPQRKALVATPTVRRRYSDQIRKRAEERDHERQLHQNASAQLQGKTVTIRSKLGKAGKLYAAVTPENISAALQEQHEVAFAADAIVIEDPIKTVGAHQVKVKVGDALVSLSVKVEKVEEKKAAAKK